MMRSHGQIIELKRKGRIQAVKEMGKGAGKVHFSK